MQWELEREELINEEIDFEAELDRQEERRQEQEQLEAEEVVRKVVRTLLLSQTFWAIGRGNAAFTFSVLRGRENPTLIKF